MVASQPGWLRFSSTPNNVKINLPAGATQEVNFGDWAGVPTWLPLLLK